MDESGNYSTLLAPYLNQTNNYIVQGDSTFAYVINTPYKIFRSILGAVNSQFTHAYDITEDSPGFRTFLNILGFLFSGYAIACFVAAMLLNRIIASNNLRSRNNQLYIPPVLNKLLHVTCVIPLVTLIICMSQELHLQLSLDYFLFNLYLVIVWSYLIETITSVSVGQLPLESTDYTIFELSIQFYTMTKLDRLTILNNGYTADCIVAVLSRLLIHIVEMFNVRRWRLLGSTLLNVGYLTFLGERVYRSGPNSMPFSTKFRQIPKVFGILIIAVSFFSYSMACLVRYTPFDNYRMKIDQLKFSSFMKNWISHTNFKGDEDFSIIVSRLAMLLCAGSNSSDKAMQKEFSNIILPSRIHSSYAISDILFQAKENLNISQDEVIATPKEVGSFGYRWSHNILSYVKRNGLWNSLLGILFRMNPYDEVDRMNDEYLRSKDMVERNNSESAYMQLKDEYDEKSDDEVDTGEGEEEADDESEEESTVTKYAQYLLHDSFDISDDASSDDDEYIPEILEEDRDTPVPFLNDMTATLEETPVDEFGEVALDNQIDLINLRSLTTDISWFFSLKNVFNFHLTHAERITRSKYSESMAHVQDACNQQKYCSETDLLCAVCKTNKREIILWPCNCFAMCDACRVSLALRGYDTCVCCRSHVDGFSHVTDGCPQ